MTTDDYNRRVKNSYLYSQKGITAFYKQFISIIDDMNINSKKQTNDMEILSDQLASLLFDINDRFSIIEKKLNIN